MEADKRETEIDPEGGGAQNTMGGKQTNIKIFLQKLQKNLTKRSALK